MNEPPYAEVTVAPLEPRRTGFLRRKLPYIAVLLCALFGIAYFSMRHQPLAGFWQAMAVAAGMLCVSARWPAVPSGAGRARLLWQQLVHWAAVVATMNIVLLPGVQSMMSAQAAGLMMILFFALGAFLAGASTSLQIAFLGFAMAIAVPAMVWLRQSLLFLFLGAAAIIGCALTLWRR